MNLKSLGANKTEIKVPGGLTLLISYATPVACIWTNGKESTSYATEKKWSATTTRHIKQWLGGPAMHLKPQSYFDHLLSEVK